LIDVETCSSDDYLTVEAEGPGGYLSSQVSPSSPHGRGSTHCPWTLTARPGQRIHLSVVDFSLAARYQVTVSREYGGLESSYHHDGGLGSDHDDPEYCHMYAIVREVTGDRSVFLDGMLSVAVHHYKNPTWKKCFLGLSEHAEFKKGNGNILVHPKIPFWCSDFGIFGGILGWTTTVSSFYFLDSACVL
jgi:hypothetical protein